MAEETKGIASYIQKGDIIDVVNTTDTAWAYHEIVPLATGIGIAQEETEPNETGGLAIVGVHGLPTDETDIPIGTTLYFAAGKAVKTAADGAVIAGTSVGAPAGGVVPVKINAVFAAGTGAAGAAGTPGKDGAAGKDGVGVKTIALTKDANGAITAGTWTDTADKSHDITVTTAGA